MYFIAWIILIINSILFILLSMNANFIRADISVDENEFDYTKYTIIGILLILGLNISVCINYLKF